jgi:hypothetical protein
LEVTCVSTNRHLLSMCNALGVCKALWGRHEKMDFTSMVKVRIRVRHKVSRHIESKT